MHSAKACSHAGFKPGILGHEAREALSKHPTQYVAKVRFTFSRPLQLRHGCVRWRRNQATARTTRVLQNVDKHAGVLESVAHMFLVLFDH